MIKVICSTSYRVYLTWKRENSTHSERSMCGIPNFIPWNLMGSMQNSLRFPWRSHTCLGLHPLRDSKLCGGQQSVLYTHLMPNYMKEVLIASPIDKSIYCRISEDLGLKALKVHNVSQILLKHQGNAVTKTKKSIIELCLAQSFLTVWGKCLSLQEPSILINYIAIG